VKTRLESVRQRKKGDVSVFCFFKKKGENKERKEGDGDGEVDIGFYIALIIFVVVVVVIRILQLAAIFFGRCVILVPIVCLALKHIVVLQD